LSEMTLIESFRTNFSHCGQAFRTCFSTSGCSWGEPAEPWFRCRKLKHWSQYNCRVPNEVQETQFVAAIEADDLHVGIKNKKFAFTWTSWALRLSSWALVSVPKAQTLKSMQMQSLQWIKKINQFLAARKDNDFHVGIIKSKKLHSCESTKPWGEPTKPWFRCQKLKHWSQCNCRILKQVEETRSVAVTEADDL
jgi:hypothetical protein